MESEPSKKRRMQTFKMEYSAEWPVLKPSKVGQNHAFCSVCKLDISISHGGRDDCRRHVLSKKHKEYAKLQKAPRIDTFFQSSTSISADHEIIKAETLLPPRSEAVLISSASVSVCVCLFVCRCSNV